MGWKARLISKYLRLYAPFPPRQFHAFGIGAPKTGTTSLAKVFSRGFRVCHEPETIWTIDLAIRMESGAISRREAIARLHRRDRRMRLDLEASHPLIYLAEEIVEAFPAAKFVVTVREPRSWLNSRISYHDFRRTRSWEPYHRHFLHDRASEFLPAEESLKQRGLVPLRTYLTQYEDHYRRVREFLPPDRTMVVRTDRLDRELPEIARFLGASPEKCHVAHDNTQPERSPALAHLDPRYVDAAIAQWCPSVIQHWFPEKVAHYSSAVHPQIDRFAVRRPRGIKESGDSYPTRRSSGSIRRQSGD